ncbi:hypothetical protein NQ314_003577 [Rhamnusium bicolor]|uniref:WD repeat, SAM and U-box domain-containing protein 1 n=1 Tax=Rhamnusium bicolor TaxID=1586634 RepID=A0AAV8ZLP0_9CUCU|nr:hypothetical protein NQ314_003577 [Rhamnusium bicolor]
MSIDGQCKKILQTLKCHTSDVTSCDFATNFTLVTGSSDKTVRIWDWIPGSGYVQRSNSPLKGHKYQVTCVRISPQGSMLASSSVDGTAVLWNLHSCAKLYTMTQVNGDPIRVCRFSPDSSILVTAGDNGAVCVWDMVHRSLIKTLFEHEGTTQSLAFTPDSQYLVTACSLEVIRVWYVQDLIDTTSDTVSSITKIDNALDMGVFSVDICKHIIFDENNPLIRQYKLATGGNSNEIKLWTITSKSVLKHKLSSKHEVIIEPYDIYDGHSSSVTCIRYSNNGAYLISSSLDKLVKIWDNNGACIATLEGHNRYVNCVAISKDSSLIASGSTGSNDKLIIIWDLTGNLSLDSELFHQTLSIQNTNGIHEFQLTENTDVNANEVTLLEKIDDIAEGAINSCCFFGNDLLATGSGDKLVRVFKVVEENNNIEEISSSPFEGHTYAINHVEFSKDGTMLASCSLDGCTTIWSTTTGEKYTSMPKNSLSVKICRFSPNCELLITAGDDEKVFIWNVNTMEKQATLEGHLDTVTSACFSPDSEVIITVSFNADFRIWSAEDYRCLYVNEDAHEYGIQSCDISQNLEPIPNVVQSENLQLDELEVKLWRSLLGHGGNVVCVRFSQIVSEFVCSTATDRQARIWSVYSADCLYVLDHDSIVTSCSFNLECSLLVTGCLDKTLWLWKLPQQLVFQTAVANKIHCRSKAVIEWTTADIVKWLKDIDMKAIIKNAQNTSLNGEKILTLSEEVICSGLDLGNLKIPHEYLCPITHEIMREPVTCSDGFTYEKNAIAEWFMSGKLTSPMTNEILSKTDYVYNLDLRNAIHNFLDAGESNISEDES